MQGFRASAAMILTWLPQNNLASAPEGLKSGHILVNSDPRYITYVQCIWNLGIQKIEKNGKKFCCAQDQKLPSCLQYMVKLTIMSFFLYLHPTNKSTWEALITMLGWNFANDTQSTVHLIFKWVATGRYSNSTLIPVTATRGPYY